MKAQHKYSTARQGTLHVTMLVGMTLVVLFGGLLTMLNRSTSQQLSIRQETIEAPAALSARPATTNRIFQDEINAAAVEPAGAVPARPVTINRIFQDEINAAAVPDHSLSLPNLFTGPVDQRGPR